MKDIKPLYNIPKAGAHRFNTYHTHHMNELSMIEFSYDFCLFYIDSNDKSFGVVSLQTDNILILINDIFAATKEKELKKGKLLAKNRKKQTLNIPIKFNRSYIRLVDANNSSLSQKKQY